MNCQCLKNFCLPVLLFAAYAPTVLAAPQQKVAGLSSDEYLPFGIYEETAPRAAVIEPIATELPLKLGKGNRIALIGNTLLERSQEFGQFEAMLHQQFPDLELVVRHLAWSADAIDVEPSSKIHEKFQNHQFVTREGRIVTGVIVKETDDAFQVAPSLLTPNTLTTIRKSDVEES